LPTDETRPSPTSKTKFGSQHFSGRPKIATLEAIGSGDSLKFCVDQMGLFFLSFCGFRFRSPMHTLFPEGKITQNYG
jgi:hypothetical protein